MSQNKYACPLDDTDIIRVSHEESPAHVGPLRYAVDFVCQEGTPVKVAADGTVIDLKSDSNVGGSDKRLEPFGNFIEIRHANGEYSEYEHLRCGGVVVKMGDAVKRGQVIGYAGATGWLAHLGPHLHFMVGRYGKDVSEYGTIEINWEKPLKNI